MKMYGVSVLAAILFCAAGTANAQQSGTPAQAVPPRQCTLPELASLDMRTSPDGKFAVPVTLNGRQVYMLVDTGSIYSSITFETAAQLGLKRRWTPFGGAFLNNVAINQYTALDSVEVGHLKSSAKWEMAVIPDQLTSESQAGLLGPDVLSGMDVEFDFFRGKLNFFRHENDCNSHVVYWTHEPYATLPIKIDRHSYHIDVEAQLDGKSVMVTFDTGASSSFMSLDAAEDLFGWNAKDPRLKSRGKESINGGEETPLYTFPFGGLNFDGVVVSNPQITLIPQDHFLRSRHYDAVIVVGMSVLRQLHVYVDYQGEMLYLTSAEAH